MSLPFIMKAFHKMQIILHGLADLLGLKTKMDVIGLLSHVRVKEQEFGGLIKIILLQREIA